MTPSRSRGSRGSIRSLMTRMQLPRAVEVAAGPGAGEGAGELRTARMTLRPLTPADWPQFARVMRENREHLSRYFPLKTRGETDAVAFARHMRLSMFSGAGAPDWRRAAFTHDGTLIGEFNLNAIRRGLEFRAESAWWVSREHCGRGYATEGVRAILELAFRDIELGGLGLHRVDALVCPENAPSLRILSKLGFVTPRTPVRVTLDVDGAWRLHELYTRYVEPAGLHEGQIEAKPLPAGLRTRIDAHLHAIEQADPGELARAVAS